MSSTGPFPESAFSFAGIPGVVHQDTPEPATPTSVMSDSDASASDFLSPTKLASSGKKFWTESSTWIASKLPYQNQHPSVSSSGYSSVDKPNTGPYSNSLQNRDPTTVERSNLLNITKLVIKSLIEWSISRGRSLESEHPPLQHFFIVLEHAMRHGLKPKKGLLGPKKELWDVLTLVEKCTNEAFDITNSIRDLPTVSTHMGRARAWLRLALMQKKLADYFKILIECRETLLKDFYEPIALMMSEEASVLAGLLVGLNVIDCNFYLKEEDLDSQQGVIDFSLYLRSSKSSESLSDETEPNNMDSVLDQKNYIEELNRHLNATVTNLQTRVETLTTTNALMKEDLAISKNTIVSLQEENHVLKLRLDQFLGSPDQTNIAQLEPLPVPKAVAVAGASSSSPTDEHKLGVGDGDKRDMSASPISPVPANLSVTDLSKKLHDERTLRSELEKEMEIRMNQKNEMEMAMSLMEKDVHEKQKTIISLRTQLEEIKVINLEMYKKLQECEKTLKYKTEFIAALESKATKLTETIDRLDEKSIAGEAELKSAHEIMRSLGVQIADKELKVSTLEGDLRIEREWRQSLQDTLIKDKEKISELNMEVQKLQLVGLELETAQQEISRLGKVCKEHEQTLEDMGVRLSESTLKMEDLKEASSSKLYNEAQWARDDEVKQCNHCAREFSITRRKHHCRNCGEIFCKLCSDNFVQLASSAKPVRVCDSCHTIHLQKWTVAASTNSSTN